MANYQTILRIRPSYKAFLREDFRHRGDVLSFPSNHQSAVYSTDAQGFRHTNFRGENLSVARIRNRKRYGLVLGTSRVFGFGLESNEQTIPSLLSERLGFPFANVALPQGNSRNLASLLLALMARSPAPPAAVVHFSTGDFSGLAFSSLADPIFGSPNAKQVDAAWKERGGPPAPSDFIQPMLSFTSLWTRWIVRLCRTNHVPIVLAHDSTFFEKAQPSQRDLECQLGMAFHEIQERWFTFHKASIHPFYARREALAAELNIPLAGPGPSNDLGFIDEFHYDESGTAALTDDIAAALEALIKS